MKPLVNTEPNKQRDLILSLIFDALGMLSFTIPVIGEFEDVIWAPLSAYLFARMYKGTAGKIGAVVEFFEEALPFTDVLPTFTLMWIYKYLVKTKKAF
ncbi:MAG: hypothetical protein EOO51_13390 [Flavobacterium sp.]|nr:MAG: hypothetical protein EOO51_13390 [Flavobacterium sp.]